MHKNKLVELSCAILAIATIGTFDSLNYSTIASSNNMVLNQTEIQQELQSLSGWQEKNNAIERTFKFDDFVSAIAFVNKLVDPAEKAGHHPDISISYNKVGISLTTHDAGGITQKDFDLAREISQLAN